MSGMSRLIVLTGTAAVGLLTAGQATTVPAPLTLPPRFSYAAKFLCGYSSATTTQPPKEPQVKRGNYATVINIHNPYNTDVTLLKKVVPAPPERFPNTRLVPPTQRYRDKLPSDHGMSVDCEEIVNLMTLSGVPPATPFIEGFVVIDAFWPSLSSATPPDIDVVAVTTIAGSTTGTVVDHEVTAVTGKRLAAGTWPF